VKLAQTSESTLSASRPMARRSYGNPPVHEVVLDVQFNEPVPEAAIADVPRLFQKSYGAPQRVEEKELEVNIGPAGEQVTTKKGFAGWLFETQDPKVVVQVSPKQITLHVVRSQTWPSGPYVGWEAIGARHKSVLGTLEARFHTTKPKRVGLRYLNRIAVPDGSALDRWFMIGLRAPSFLKNPFTFHLRETWERVEEQDDLSVTLGLAKIRIDDQQVAAGNQGVLLDIEVFNLWPQNAPPYDGLSTWFGRAHDLENQVFESCITDDLRNLFK
jgi:uncharacterized protein (TIGR04255 family)